MKPNEKRKQKQLILFPTPLLGHITPMLQLATLLSSAGFSVTIPLSTQFAQSLLLPGSQIRANLGRHTIGACLRQGFHALLQMPQQELQGAISGVRRVDRRWSDGICSRRSSRSQAA